MNYLENQMVPGERPRQIFRRHWWWLARRLITTGLATAIAWLTSQLAGGDWAWLPAAPAIYGILVAYAWSKRLLVVTNQRVILLGGLINALAKADDLNLGAIGNIDEDPDGVLAGLLGERGLKIQSGDAASGIFSDGWPAGVRNAIRTAQAQAAAQFRAPTPPAKRRTDALGHDY